MKQEELLNKITEETKLERGTVEQMFLSMAGIISETLSRGEDVVLLPDLGTFISKLNDNPALGEHSPRTKKDTQYKIRFRPGKELEKRLKLVKD